MRRGLILLGVLLAGGRIAAATPPVIESGGWSKTPGHCTGYPDAAAVEAVAERGQFCFRASFRLNARGDNDSYIYLNAVYDNDHAFLNSHAIGATGRDDPGGSHAGGYRRAYAVSATYLRIGVNEIALDVRCENQRCGPDGPALLLPAESALQRKWEDTLVGLMIAGSLLLAGLIFLIIGSGAARESYHRWFGLFVLAGAVALFTHQPAWVPEALRNHFYRLESAAAMALFPLYARFLIAARDWSSARGLRAAATALLLSSAAALVLPLGWIQPLALGQKLLSGGVMLVLFVALLWERSPQARFDRGKLAATSLLLTLSAGADLLVELRYLHMPVDWLDDYMPLALLLSALIAARVLANRYQRLRQTAYRDPLTGLNSRRFMDEFIPAELSRAARLGHPVTALFIDIDHFKRVNDRYGHAAGDVVLRALAQRLTGLRREGDYLCRWGGEEFALFMFGQGLQDAEALAERMRAAVAGEPFALGRGLPALPLTISIGVAALSPENDSLAQLIAATDQALYAAKSAGRNQVMTAPTPAESPAVPAGRPVEARDWKNPPGSG